MRHADPWTWIVPDALWETARPLLPEPGPRPQGGGTANTSGDALFAAVVYILLSGCAWRSLPPCFGISKSTAHRRFLNWTDADLWNHLHEALQRRPGTPDLTTLSGNLRDEARLRTATGANIRTREPWTTPGGVPTCDSCWKRTDCPGSASPQAAT